VRALSRFQRYLRSLQSRIVGSHVELGSEQVTWLSTQAKFWPDEMLELRRAAARDLMGDAQVKPLWKKPRPVDLETELPIG